MIELDMYQTIALAVAVLMLGKYLRRRCRVLEKFCIPAPVIGGVIFAVFTCLCYVTGIVEFSFDDILKEVCMVFFFTSVGFQANLKILKSGGKALAVFLLLVVVLILCQNFLAVALAGVLQMDVLKGFCIGSIPMVGGHGTAGAFGLVLEKMGVEGASTLFCEGLSADPVGRKSVCRFYQQPCDHFIYQSFVAGRHKMFWNIRKKDGTGYKIESENLAVPEIHRSDEEPTEEMEQENEDSSITYDDVAIPEIHIRRKRS